MKTILITGVSGFLGKHFYNSLIKEYTVFGISTKNPGLKNCFEVNLLDKESTQSFFKDKKFDIILHFASILAKANNLSDTGVYKDNIQMTLNLAEALKEQEHAHLINFSSSSVYLNSSDNCTETSLIDPSQNADGLYGLAKFNSEMLFNYLLKNKLSVTNLRVPMVYGENMESSRIHSVFKKELHEKNTITLFAEGKRVISHISIELLIEKVKKIITGNIPGTFNVDGESISMLDLATRIILENGNKSSKVVFAQGGSPVKFIFNGSKLNSKLVGA